MHETGTLTCFKSHRLSNLPILAAWWNLGRQSAAPSLSEALFPLKAFQKQSMALHHCTYLPRTAKVSTALGLLQLHCHSLRKPQNPPRHSGGAVGCYRWARACLAVCPWGDKPRRKWRPRAADCRQSFCSVRASPTQKSTCSWLASIPISGVTAAAAFFTRPPHFYPQMDNTLSALTSRTSADPHVRFPLINKPRLQTLRPAPASKHITGLRIPNLSSNLVTITSLLPERKSRPALTKWITTSGIKLLSSRMNQDTGDPVYIFISLTTTQEHTSKLFVCLF